MDSTVVSSLKNSLDDFKSALDWLNHSYELCNKTGIKDNYSVEELDAFENLTSRYARATDFLIHKLFRSIDAVEFLEATFGAGKTLPLLRLPPKSLFQIGDNIVNMLSANGKPNGIWLYALLQKLITRELRMRCACRMYNQRFGICNIGKKREQFQLVNELLRLLRAAFDFKSEN